MFPLVVGILLAPMFVQMLHRLKFGQEIRKEGPQSHLKKQGTPTMGGILFIVLLLAYALSFRIFSFSAAYILASVLLFSAIGLADDLLKIRRKNSDGLSSKQKLALQVAVSVVLGIAATNFGTLVVFPFFRVVNAGIFYVPLLVFMYVSLTNAVNLTDGLDGLATTVTSVVVLLLAVIAYFSGSIDVFEMCVIMLASMLAFLVFNWHPAKMIMGDTGSFALGGFVAAASVALGVPLLIPIFGLLYVCEALSVMIQVAYYKRTKKRIFKMSPIHHHYELSGYSEVRIVLMFSGFTALCCVVGYFAWYMAVN
ncbi:MAG: phospho-N-acetylmuramoyl-pentapeptide-transferase [Bacillota bacterium]|nr:phospho-N-acetylmuramoyl-pentapeptide-transferase [Bacillota bacterium]